MNNIVIFKIFLYLYEQVIFELMKKLIFILLITVSGLTSCKKNYNCSCELTKTFPDGGKAVSVQTTNLIDLRKKEAEVKCDDFGRSFTPIFTEFSCHI